MSNERGSGFEGFIFAIFGLILYVINEFIPYTFIRVLCAFCFVMAIINLFEEYIESKKKQKLTEEIHRYEKLKETLTKEASKKHERSQPNRKNEKSENDADFK